MYTVLEKMPEVHIQKLWVTLGIAVNSATAMCNTQQGIYYQREILLFSPIPLPSLLQKIPPPLPPQFLAVPQLQQLSDVWLYLSLT